MVVAAQSLRSIVTLLKSKASIYAVGGILIAVGAALIATMLAAYLYSGSLALDALLAAQRSNPVLWLLDVLPLIFALWGQYSGTLIAYRAGAMVLDETRDLTTQVSALRYQLEHADKRSSMPEVSGEDQWFAQAGRAIRAADENGSLLAVLAVDFDHFHELQDALSRRERDALRHNIAARLQGVMRTNDILTHLEDDEFAILLPNLSEPREIGRLGKQIKTALDSPLRLGNKEVKAQVCIGVALFPNHGTQAQGLLAKARVAKEQARATRKSITIYRQHMENQSMSSRLALMSHLRQALERGEGLIPLYSIQTDTRRDESTHVRMQLSWETPQSQSVSECQTWALAEEAGLLRQLLNWTLNTGLGSLRQWEQPRGLALHISFSLPEPAWRELPVSELLKGVAAAHEVSPERITVECTEDALLGGGEHAMETLRDLRSMGTGLCLSGFGGPQSSPAAVLDFRFDEVRLAPALTAHAAEDGDTATVLTALLEMVRGIGIDSVVPGINDKLIYEALLPLHCSRMEGAYIAQPQSAAALRDWIGLQTMHIVSSGIG